MSDDPDKLVSIYRTSNSSQAWIVRNALIAEGIACEVMGDLQGGYAGIFYEVRLLVRAEDVQRAKAFIEEHERPMTNDAGQTIPSE